MPIGRRSTRRPTTTTASRSGRSTRAIRSMRPGHEPAGYMEWLAQQEPEVAFDPAALRSDADWVAAGETVFDAPIGYGATFKLAAVRDPEWYAHNHVPVTRDGMMPFSRYVVRKKGVVEVGSGSCLMCHARVMPDGTLLKGAQGNFPADRIVGYNLRQQAAATRDPAALLDGVRLGQRTFFSMPWLAPDPIARVATMSIEEIAERLRSGAGRGVDARQPQPVRAGADSRSDRRPGAALPRSHRPGAAALDRRSDALRRDRAGRECVRSLRRFPARRSGARSDQDGALQRRAALRARTVSLFVEAAAEPEPRDARPSGAAASSPARAAAPATRRRSTPATS